MSEYEGEWRAPEKRDLGRRRVWLRGSDRTRCIVMLVSQAVNLEQISASLRYDSSSAVTSDLGQESEVSVESRKMFSDSDRGSEPQRIRVSGSLTIL